MGLPRHPIEVRDQADPLRRMAWQARTARGGASPPKVIVFAGGHPGVGTTSVLWNTAAALFALGTRGIVITAGTTTPTQGTLTLVDVLRQSHAIHEVLQRGPLGLLTTSGAWNDRQLWSLPDAAWNGLDAQFQSMAPYAEAILIDLGNEPSDASARLWQGANLGLLVCTPEDAAVTGAYARLKMLAQLGSGPRMMTVLNRSDASDTQRQIHLRLAQSARNFLRVPLEIGGTIPLEASASPETGQLGIMAGASYESLARRIASGGEATSSFQPAANRAPRGSASLAWEPERASTRQHNL